MIQGSPRASLAPVVTPATASVSQGTGFLATPRVLDVLSQPRADKLRHDVQRMLHESGYVVPYYDAKRERVLEGMYLGVACDPTTAGVIAALHELRAPLHAIPEHIPVALASALAVTPLEEARKDTFWSGWLERLMQTDASIDAERPQLRTAARPVRHWWSNFVESAPAKSSAEIRMPLLGRAAKAWHAANPGNARPLAGFELCAIQHFMGQPAGSEKAKRPYCTTEELLHALEAEGVPRSLARLMGKPYSADPAVLDALRWDGWTVDHSTERWLCAVADDTSASHAASAAAYHHLRRMFAGVDPNAADAPRFLLLDDGGKLIKALHEDPSPWGESLRRFAPLCVAVEQTTKGLTEIAGLELACPVVNLAGSQTKRDIEGEIIGENIVASTLAEAALDGHSKLEERGAVVRGFGAVGEKVAKALHRRGFRVTVSDIDEAALKRAEAQGYEVVRARDGSGVDHQQTLARAHLLISVTGGARLSDEHWQYLPPGAVLANGASGRDELMPPEALHQPFQAFRHTAPVMRQYAGFETRIVGHQPFTWPPPAPVRVLRNGFVINMRYDLPPEVIQFTRAMILVACMQASVTKTPGIVPLDPLLEAQLANDYKELRGQPIGSG